MACQYCGVSKPGCLVRCNRSGKWFCNGSSGTVGSHIVHHLVRSKNREVTLHPENALGDLALECYNCGTRNVFLLGFVPSTGGVVVLLCREPCLHNNTLRDMDWDLDQWQPLVEERKLLKWLVPPPKRGTELRPIKGVEALRLEELWAEKPDARLEDVHAMSEEEEVEPVQMRYKDGSEYRKGWGELVQMEMDHDRALLERCAMSGVTLRWEWDGDAASHPKAVFVSRLHAEGAASARPVLWEEVELEYPSMGMGMAAWKTRGSVCRCSETGELAVEVNSTAKATPMDVTEGFEVKFIWSSRVFSRMLAALKRLDQGMPHVSKVLLKLILGMDVPPPPPDPMYLPDGGWLPAGSKPSERPLRKLGYSYSELDRLESKISAPHLPQLNASQSAAVRQVLQSPLSLVQGPPGTGKTVTSATIVYHMARAPDMGQILVCAPSNVAVDQLTEKIARTGLKVVRLCARSREALDSPVRDLTLHCMVDNLKPDSPVLSKFPWAKQYQKLREKEAAGTGLSSKEEKWMHARKGALHMLLMQAADVICCTCMSAGDSRLNKFSFKGVLLDECTQATEPTTLIPLTKGARQVVLVGDHSQLGPVVPCKKAAKAGLTESMFQRLVTLGHVPIRLQVQYRMHPSLSEFPSNMFYEGSLQNGVSASQRRSKAAFPWPRPDCPMMFYVQTGLEELGASGTSYLNRTEATSVEKIVTMFLRARVHPEKIGVITPYEGQRAHVVSYMQRAGPLKKDLYDQVEVASVDSYQGREKDFIILSCVRSNEHLGIGFLSDPRRLNVALTRARLGCVILGNPRSLSRHGLWHELLSHFKKSGCMVEGSLNNLKQSFFILSKPKKPFDRNSKGHVFKYAEQVAYEKAMLQQAVAYQEHQMLLEQQQQQQQSGESGSGGSTSGSTSGGSTSSATLGFQLPPGTYAESPSAHGMPMLGYGVPMQHYGMPLQGYGVPMQHYGMPLQGFPPPPPTWAAMRYDPNTAQYSGVPHAAGLYADPGSAHGFVPPPVNGSAVSEPAAPQDAAASTLRPEGVPKERTEAVAKQNNDAQFFSMILDFCKDPET